MSAASTGETKRRRGEQDERPSQRFPLGRVMLIFDARSKRGVSHTRAIKLADGVAPDWLLWTLGGVNIVNDDECTFFNVHFDEDDITGVFGVISETLPHEVRVQRMKELEKFVDDVSNDRFDDEHYCHCFTGQPFDFIMTVI